MNCLLHWYEPLNMGLYGYVEVSSASEFSFVYLVIGQQYCVLAEVCKWVFCSTGQETLVCLSIWQWWATTNWCLLAGFYWTWFNIFISFVKFYVQHCCVCLLSNCRLVSWWTMNSSNQVKNNSKEYSSHIWESFSYFLKSLRPYAKQLTMSIVSLRQRLLPHSLICLLAACLFVGLPFFHPCLCCRLLLLLLLLLLCYLFLFSLF